MSITKVTNDNIASLEASKLTGSFPSIDGSNLTNMSSFTKSSSDPAIDTNPSGSTGTLWLNTTSGEMFCCTDATTDENVWTNIGAGEGDIIPWVAWRATISGYHTGGTVPTVSTIEKYSFTSDENSTVHGNLSIVKAGHSGQSSRYYGYSSGGSATVEVDVIDKFAFAGSNVTATDVGNLTIGRSTRAGQSSPTHGYTSGGGGSTNIIDKFTFAADADATDVGDLTQGRHYVSGQSSQNHGYASGGHNPSNSDVIDKFTFASDANATDVGNLTSARGLTSGQSSETHGYASGGYTSSTAIDKFSFASDGNATNIGNLLLGGQCTGGSSSTTHGYEAGGYNPSTSNHTKIEKFSFATDGNSISVGELNTALRYGAGNQY